MDICLKREGCMVSNISAKSHNQNIEEKGTRRVQRRVHATFVLECIHLRVISFFGYGHMSEKRRVHGQQHISKKS